jgi:hypothetical protein
MNPATYNIDFPPYLTPVTSLCYTQKPTYHAITTTTTTTTISPSQLRTSNPTHAHKDTSLAGPSADNNPTSAFLQTKAITHQNPHSPAETLQTVSRKITRNMEEQERPNAKKKKLITGWEKP